MGQILHGSATTTEAIRRAIQNSQESLRALANRHGINQKTVAKWKNRATASDLKTGPKEPKSTVLECFPIRWNHLIGKHSRSLDRGGSL
jgi:Helix-turn-helix domain